MSPCSSSGDAAVWNASLATMVTASIEAYPWSFHNGFLVTEDEARMNGSLFIQDSDLTSTTGPRKSPQIGLNQVPHRANNVLCIFINPHAKCFKTSIKRPWPCKKLLQVKACEQRHWWGVSRNKVKPWSPLVIFATRCCMLFKYS